jgi:hypothetical protein
MKGELNMKRTFNFGKIDYYGHGRKINPVSITIELRDTPKGVEFSAMGDVWNSKKTDIVAGGQIIDDLGLYIGHKALYRQILSLWKKYHLNTMHAGTPEQEKCLEDFKSERAQIAKYLNTYENDYDVSCKVLESHGLLEVNLNGEKYKYGSAWLYQPIPEEDYKKILSLLEDTGN